MATIEEKVQKIVADKLEVNLDQVVLNASFTDDLRADSLAIIDLIMDMEDAFKVQIPDEEADNIRTVGDAVERLKVLIQNKVTEVVSQQLGKELTAETALDGGLGSNEEIRKKIADTFAIEVSEKAASSINTVKEVAEYVIANVGPVS